MKLRAHSFPFPIKEFAGEFRFLSNFYPCTVIYGNVEYPAVENAYQAQKTLNLLYRKAFVDVKPGAAKKMGQGIKLRPDWHAIKVPVMRDLLAYKFNSIPFDIKLLATGDKYLFEGNRWHDNFWGGCICEKCRSENILMQNTLGELLMDVRENLQTLVLTKTK